MVARFPRSAVILTIHFFFGGGGGGEGAFETRGAQEGFEGVMGPEGKQGSNSHQ